MLPYWLIFTLCAAGALEHRRRQAREFQGGPLLLAIGLLLILVVGLRWEVGGDWENYLRIFEYFRFVDDVSIVVKAGDPGYSLLNWTAQQVGVGVWFVNLSCAAILVWGLTKFARQQPNPWLVFAVAVPYLVIVVGMGYTRQAAAIGFILAGLATLHRRSVLHFAIYIAFGALFHKTAVVILPLVAVASVKQRASATVGILIIGSLLYYFFLQSSVDRLLQIYEEAGYQSDGAGIRVAMNVVPAVIYLLTEKKFELTDFQSRLWRYFALGSLGAVALLLTLQSSTAVDRLALYLLPIQLFVLSRLPYVFQVNGRANGQVSLAVLTYSALVQFVWLNYANHSRAWIPYDFYPTATETRRPWLGD